MAQKRLTKKEQEELVIAGRLAEEEAKKKQLEEEKKKQSSRKFVLMMTFVSLAGFFGIAMKTLFETDVDIYVEVCWLLFLGGGLIWESNLKEIFKLSDRSLNSDKFSKLVTLVVGLLAVITGILILPQINWQTPALLAIKGVISIVAIIFIVLQRILFKE